MTGSSDPTPPRSPAFAIDTVLLEHLIPGFMEQVDAWRETHRAKAEAFGLTFTGWVYESTREQVEMCLWYTLQRGVPVIVAPPEMGKTWQSADAGAGEPSCNPTDADSA